MVARKAAYVARASMSTPKDTTTAMMIVRLLGPEALLVVPPVVLSELGSPPPDELEPEYARTEKLGFIICAIWDCTPLCW